MRRDQLEHLIRASATIVDTEDVVVVGSQAVLAEHPQAPEELLRSVEADIYPRDHPELADQIDGAIGEGSLFQTQFGYYAHGVGPEATKAPEGWERRLVPIRNENTRGLTGWCLETHDIVLAKCVARRQKDFDWIDAALEHGLVDPDELRRRIPSIPVSPRERADVEQLIEGRIAKVARETTARGAGQD